MADERKVLSDEILESVAGGAGQTTAEFREKRKEFDTAWERLKMDSYGYSGMKMATLYDEWEMAGYAPDAATFLSTKMA